MGYWRGHLDFYRPVTVFFGLCVEYCHGQIPMNYSLFFIQYQLEFKKSKMNDQISFLLFKILVNC